MTVEIRLIPSNFSVTLTRDQILTLKGSLLAQALETDSEAKLISLDNPVVRPQELQAIARMARQEPLEWQLATGEEVEARGKAADYLNWPLLEVELYPIIHQFAPYANLYRPETFGSLLPWAIQWNYSALIRHIFRIAPPGPLDEQALMVAIYYRNMEAVKMLLHRGINPATAHVEEIHILSTWIHQTEPGFFIKLMRLSLTDKMHQALYLLVLTYTENPVNQQLLTLLLGQEELKTGPHLQKALHSAMHFGKEDVAVQLIQQTDVDPNILVETKRKGK
ncbi:MAG TPA: hypothetical protein VKH37_02370, partial [Ferruginibacter sp.]|nr:hypothetical protein [Ferruginibacter sp.]